MVISPDDPRLAPYRALTDPAALRAQGLFVAEGRMVVRRLVDASPFRVHSLLVTTAAREALTDLLPRLPDEAPVLVIAQEAMNEVAGFNIHRGCLALAYRTALAGLDTINLAACRRLLVLEGVNNPDNVGGLFRNAAAFGVDAVVLGPNCGDPLYRKAIRTSMGGALEVPFVDAGAWPDALDRLAAAGVRVIALTPGAGVPALDELPAAHGPLALLVGAEGEGLTAAALAAARERARIPMAARLGSVNVATAAAIGLYHFADRTAAKPR
ncbi:MAG: RNA methyltransferase [Vicinamibacterales bacterium]|nr:RNA methyltransferase [Vicinamibacterales bacterium]